MCVLGPGRHHGSLVLAKKDLPADGHQLYVCWSAHEGCREAVRRSCLEVRECLFLRIWAAVVCLLTEGRDAVRESVYVNADETLASW